MPILPGAVVSIAKALYERGARGGLRTAAATQYWLTPSVAKAHSNNIRSCRAVSTACPCQWLLAKM